MTKVNLNLKDGESKFVYSDGKIYQVSVVKMGECEEVKDTPYIDYDPSRVGVWYGDKYSIQEQLGRLPHNGLGYGF